MNEKKIKILSALSQREFVERLRHVLGDDCVTDSDCCDCAIAVLDGYESVNTKVAAAALEALGRGITVIPIDATKEQIALCDAVAQIANPAIVPSICECCAPTPDPSENAAQTAEPDAADAFCDESPVDDSSAETEKECTDGEDVSAIDEAAPNTETAADAEMMSDTVEPIVTIENEPTHQAADVPATDETACDNAASCADAHSSVTCSCGAQVDSDMLFCWSCGRSMTTPKCSCGADIIPDTAFCWSCGKHLVEHELPDISVPATPHCPSCGTEISSSDKFCASCGARL